MKYLISILIILLIPAGCTRQQEAGPATLEHQEMNSAYYWKTVFHPDNADMDFIRRHNIGRIYLRMFDVVPDEVARRLEDATYPNASVRICADDVDRIASDLATTEFVPVVYITLDALKTMKNHEGILAANIVKRVSNMCSYYELPNVAELQLDCDWTASTQESYFRLCDSVKYMLGKKDTPWQLSSTIRLHQLSGKVPPVERGVLMVYNTGTFSDPDAANSIIDAKDVEPYLKHLSGYPLHLDIAYPTYSWQLLFRQRQFVGLLNGVDVADTARFTPRTTNQYEARKDIPYGERIIRRGDVIRSETSAYEDILSVKRMIDRHLGTTPHSNILYHLDSTNLSKYTSDEISTLLAAGH